MEATGYAAAPSILSNKPKMSELQKYVRSHRDVVERWEDVAVALGLGDHDDGEQLDKIGEDKKGDCNQCFNEAMKLWLRGAGLSAPQAAQTSSGCNWSTLIEAIKSFDDLKETGALIEKQLLASTVISSSGPNNSTRTNQCQATIQEPSNSTSDASLSSSTPLAEPCTNTECSPSTTNGTGLATQPSTEDETMELEEVVIDYSVKLEPGKKVREYQEELAEPGIAGKNCIIVAPTGSGKTLVAALIISNHLQKNQHNEVRPIVLFVVNTRPLAEQQKKVFKQFISEARVDCSMGDGGPSVADLMSSFCDIIVCTAGKLLDSIKSGRVTFDQISLMVIDECHHTKKSSPQANIMLRYLEHKAKEGSAKVPQVIGLTASPGAGDNPHLDQKKTMDHLFNLCAHLDATEGIVTVKKYQDELDSYTNKPTSMLESHPGRNVCEPFIETVVSEMNEVEKNVPFMKSAFEKWSQEYETNVQQYKVALELSTDPKFRDQISTLCLLRCYSQALNIYMDLRCDDAIRILQEYCDGLPTNDSQATQHEQKLKESLQCLLAKLICLPPIENPLLGVAEEKLADVFSAIPDSKVIFFVQTKKHALSVCEWIKSISRASKYGIHPRILTGHTRDTGAGMTQVEQQEVMESFRNGDCNLLIATSVAEEGLDVPACNLVIRFQHVSNEIAKVQTQGRARAEESEGLTILSNNSKRTLQEMKNDQLLQLVEECMQLVPTGEQLVSTIKQRQDEIVKQHKQKLALRKRVSAKHNASDVQLYCKRCKVSACVGSDIYIISSTHRAVPDKQFQQKIIKRPHDKPRPLSQVEELYLAKTHKIYCAKCDADWGVLAKWPSKGMDFPILKCKSFIFQVKGDNKPAVNVSQWSVAPFESPDFSSWLKVHNLDEMIP